MRYHTIDHYELCKNDNFPGYTNLHSLDEDLHWLRNGGLESSRSGHILSRIAQSGLIGKKYCCESGTNYIQTDIDMDTILEYVYLSHASGFHTAGKHSVENGEHIVSPHAQSAIPAFVGLATIMHRPFKEREDSQYVAKRYLREALDLFEGHKNISEADDWSIEAACDDIAALVQNHTSTGLTDGERVVLERMYRGDFGILEEGSSFNFSDAMQQGVYALLAFEKLRGDLRDEDTVRKIHTVASLSCLARQGVSKNKYVTSLTKTGPRYLRENEEGIPIPGEIHRDIAEPTAGFDSIDAVVVKDGGLEIIGSVTQPGLQPVVSLEDIQTIKALMFGYDRPVFPGFSLEDVDGSNPQERLTQRVFSPEWTANTQLGQTLYYTDFLMKVLTNGKQLSSTSQITSRSIEELCGGELPSIINDLAAAKQGEHPKDHPHWRLCLVPKHISLSRSTQNGSIVYVAKDVAVGVESSLYGVVDGVERKDLFPNDMATTPGRIAHFFTKNYDAISSLFPEFERLRQLFGLAHLMKQTREDGFMVDPTSREGVASFIKMHSTTKPTFTIKPTHGASCLCIGGVNMGESSAHVESHSSLDDAIRREREQFSAAERQIREQQERRAALESSREITKPIGHVLDTFEFARHLTCETAIPSGTLTPTCVRAPDVDYASAIGAVGAASLATGIAVYAGAKRIKGMFS